MQYFNLTTCLLLFNIISFAVHALLPSVLQCLNSNGVKVFLLSLKRVLYSGNDVIISLIPVSSQMFGTEKNQMEPNQENMEVINQFKSTVMHSGHCNYRLELEHRPGETGYFLSAFQATLTLLLFAAA